MSNISLNKRYFLFILFYGAFFCLQTSILGQYSNIVIIKSAVNTEVNLTYEGIKSGIKESPVPIISETTIIILNNKEEDEFWEEIYLRNPSVIVTIGSPATSSAISHNRQIPIVYTLTLGSFENLIQDSSYAKIQNINGISIMIPLKKQIDVLIDALPTIGRVGVLYTSAL